MPADSIAAARPRRAAPACSGTLPMRQPIAVDGDQIGERAADLDADPHGAAPSFVT